VGPQANILTKGVAGHRILLWRINHQVIGLNPPLSAVVHHQVPVVITVRLRALFYLNSSTVRDLIHANLIGSWLAVHLQGSAVVRLDLHPVAWYQSAGHLGIEVSTVEDVRDRAAKPGHVVIESITRAR